LKGKIRDSKHVRVFFKVIWVTEYELFNQKGLKMRKQAFEKCTQSQPKGQAALLD
jgi:hypothetical protein